MAKLFLEFPAEEIPSCCRECPVREEHYSPVTDKTKCRISNEWNDSPNKKPENCPMGHMLARDDFKRNHYYGDENDELCHTCGWNSGNTPYPDCSPALSEAEKPFCFDHNQWKPKEDERSCKTCDNCLAYQDEQNYECYGVPECKDHDHWTPRQEPMEEDAPCEACRIDIPDDDRQIPIDEVLRRHAALNIARAKYRR